MQIVAAYLGSIGGFVQANMLSVIVACMFGFVFLALFAIMQVAYARQAVRRRAIAFNPAATPGLSLTGGFDPKRSSEVAELLFSVERGLSSAAESGVSKIRTELVRAGFFGRSAVFWYYVARFTLAGLLGLGVFLLITGFGPPTTALGTLGFTLGSACFGLMIPSFVVTHQQRRLLRQSRNGFPDFLDLLVVCTEAGLTPRAGIERVSRELAATYPFLGANLFLMCLELRAGRPMAEAIESLSRRVLIDEVRSLGSLLQQTEELGTNLTSALRVYSDDMRARRLLRAEEKAHALPVKLVLPLAFFVFPVMLMVALMPLFIRIHKALF
jgi:tight adherence protein C